ncbi:MAG TPA: molybdopterin-guanine dinucleotide biosynthesis protein B [Thermoanaerobaculia bacterium]|nr:molybdopterin-guanine dinucleotide biosynthesis protein B [Thermoanaerobaculia bacterium]
MTRNPHITGFIGYSGSGKTTLILALMAEYRRRGRTVGVVKHTHHNVIDEKAGGDAEKFVEGGADDVVLVSADTITRWISGKRSATPRQNASAQTIVSSVRTEVVFVEGFKSESSWPRIAVWQPGAELPPLDGTARAVVSRAGLSTALRRFSPDDVPALADFLDTIPSS